MAVATPLLPVKQTTAQLNWPQNGTWQSVNAPLIGYVATDLTITVPCQAAAGLAGPENRGRTVLLSTVPKQAPKAVDRGLLIERVNNDLLVIVRNTPVVSAPLDAVLSPACQTLTFTAARRQGDRRIRRARRKADASDTADDPDAPLRGERGGYDFRPQIVGVFTDLSGPAPEGLKFSATIDSRYSSAPTLLKTAGDDHRRRHDRHRARRAASSRHRRRCPAPAFPAAALVVDDPAGRTGRRRPGVVALRRGQHLRRRLHPDHGPGVRAGRLHGQLLPLVRHPGGSVRLVLRPAGTVGPRLHRQHLAAATHACSWRWPAGG